MWWAKLYSNGSAKKFNEVFMNMVLWKLGLGLLSTLVFCAILFVGLLLTYDRFLFYSYGKHPKYQEIDTCLDAGGRWNYKVNHCEFAKHNND